ncbi:MAG: hypothetical protein OSA95_14475 [Opitutales bacterium]|nr:hypothetical protein [Opitutales bacterium]
MLQDDPTWSGFLHAFICFVILTYIQVILGARRMAQLKKLATNLPDHQRLKVRFIGPILAIGLRMELVVMASLLPFLGRTKVFTSQLSTGTHVAVSTQDLVLILGAIYLLLRLIGTLRKPTAETQPTHEYTQLKTLFWLDVAWTLEVIFLGLGITNWMAPILLSVLVAYLLLLFSSSAVIKSTVNNPFLIISALLLFPLSILMLILGIINLSLYSQLFHYSSILIILMTLIYHLYKKQKQ